MQSRELARYDTPPQDILQYSSAQMAEFVESRAKAWRRNRLTMGFLGRFGRAHPEIRPYQAETDILIPSTRRGQRRVEILPGWSQSDLEIDPSWSLNLPRTDPFAQTLPSQGANTCALDVSLVMGRLLHLGMSRCDQMTPSELDRLKEEDNLTHWMRLTIARPWHLLSQESVDGTRDALNDLIRSGFDASSAERTGGFLSISRTLDVLLTRCRSVSWTQQAGDRCRACGQTTFRDVSPRRLTSAAVPLDTDNARSWPELARQRFQGEQPAGTTSRLCRRCADHPLSPINLILDRLPPYLIFGVGLDKLSPQTRVQMYEDLTIAPVGHTGSSLGATQYRWLGVIEHVSSTHFVLHWRTAEDVVTKYDGFARRPTSIALSTMNTASLVPSAVIYQAVGAPQPEPPLYSSAVDIP